jgi:hypothetical protein
MAVIVFAGARGVNEEAGASVLHSDENSGSPPASETRRCLMPDVTYEIVQHDGGWAYRVNGVFSETFSTHAEALAAARAASVEQEVPGHTETIEYEHDKGNWQETASGRDRPHTVVKTWIERF